VQETGMQKYWQEQSVHLTMPSDIRWYLSSEYFQEFWAWSKELVLTQLVRTACQSHNDRDCINYDIDHSDVEDE